MSFIFNFTKNSKASDNFDWDFDTLKKKPTGIPIGVDPSEKKENTTTTTVKTEPTQPTAAPAGKKRKLQLMKK